MAWTEDKVIEKTKELTIALGADTPVVTKASGPYVWDINGKQYLDCGTGPGVMNIGHCHPRVTEVIKQQVETLTQTPGRAYTIPVLELADKIAEIAPGNLRKSFFCNSGAEAIEGAVKLSLKRAYKNSKAGMGIIALQHAFHGRLSLALALTGITGRKRGFGPFSTFPGVVHVQAPYCYRCKLKYPSCEVCCADFEELLKCSGPGEFAVFIAEPILAVGGILIPPDEYWPKIREFCDQNGITLVFDEVFIGFGRTGKLFASQHWNVVPDIMTIAKALGGGLPLGAFVSTPEVADALEVGDHYTTFGWNNVVSSAAGLEGIKVLEEERLVDNSRDMGKIMLEGLRALAERSDIMGDVRGKGLLVGVELVEDKESRVPYPDAAKKISASMMERGIIVAPTGSWSNVVRIVPTLTINEGHVEQVISTFESALKDIGVPAVS